MTPEARKFYYDFVHIGLPKFFFETGEKLYKSIASGNPSQEISRLWNTCATEFNLRLNDVLECQIISMDNNLRLVLITLPRAVQETETVLVGLVFFHKQQIFSNQIEARRYFILELGSNHNEFFFCERLITKEHLNYGALVNGTTRTFVQSLNSLITGGVIERKPTPTLQDEKRTELEQSLRENELEFLEVIKKRSKDVPKDVFDKAEVIAKPLFRNGTVIFSLLGVHTQIPKTKLDAMQQEFYSDVTALAGRSMVLGFDYGIGCENKSSSTEDSNKDINNSMRLLRNAGEVVVMEYMSLADAYIKSNPATEIKPNSIMKIAFDVQQECFKLGVDYAEFLKEKKIEKTDPQDNRSFFDDFHKKMHSDIFSKRFTSQAVLDKWETRIPEELSERASLLMDNFRNECEMDFQQLKIAKIMPEFVLIAYEKIIKDVIMEISHNSLALGAEYGESGMCEDEQINNYADIPDEASNYLAEFGEPASNLTFMLEQQLLKLGKQADNAKSKYVTSLMEGQIECFKLGVKYGVSNRPDNSILKKSNDDKFELSDTFNDLLDVAFHDPDPSVRQQAQDGLRELHPGGPEGFDDMICDLIEGLRDPTKRASSLEKLPAHREMALPMLIKYLKDPDPNLRKLVTQVIIIIEKGRPRNKV